MASNGIELNGTASNGTTSNGMVGQPHLPPPTDINLLPQPEHDFWKNPHTKNIERIQEIVEGVTQDIAAMEPDTSTRGKIRRDELQQKLAIWNESLRRARELEREWRNPYDERMDWLRAAQSETWRHENQRTNMRAALKFYQDMDPRFVNPDRNSYIMMVNGEVIEENVIDIFRWSVPLDHPLRAFARANIESEWNEGPLNNSQTGCRFRRTQAHLLDILPNTHVIPPPDTWQQWPVDVEIKAQCDPEGNHKQLFNCVLDSGCDHMSGFQEDKDAMDPGGNIWLGRMKRYVIFQQRDSFETAYPVYARLVKVRETNSRSPSPVTDWWEDQFAVQAGQENVTENKQRLAGIRTFYASNFGGKSKKTNLYLSDTLPALKNALNRPGTEATLLGNPQNPPPEPVVIPIDQSVAASQRARLEAEEVLQNNRFITAAAKANQAALDANDHHNDVQAAVAAASGIEVEEAACNAEKAAKRARAALQILRTGADTTRAAEIRVRDAYQAILAANAPQDIIDAVNADRLAAYADFQQSTLAVQAVQNHVANAQNSARLARTAADAFHLAGPPGRALHPRATYGGSLRQ